MKKMYAFTFEFSNMLKTMTAITGDLSVSGGQLVIQSPDHPRSPATKWLQMEILKMCL